MPDAGEYHGDAELVGRGDHLVVAHAATWLYHRLRARPPDHLDAVAEGEEGVGGDHRSLERQSGFLRFQLGDACRVDAAHLPRADTECASVLAEDDGVR